MINTNTLRQMVFEAAVNGLLSERLETDSSATELIERINIRREELQRAKIVKKAKPSSPIQDDEIPFEGPTTWQVVRLNEIAWFGGGHTPSTSDASNYCPNGIPWITSKDMKADRIYDSQITLTDKGASSLTRYPAGTLLMVTRSGILRRVLPVAILMNEATINQDQKAIVPFDFVISEWLLIYLKACDTFIRRKYGKTGATVESIIFDRVKEMPISIPPLSEQNRIVERVRAIIEQIDVFDEAQHRYASSAQLLRSRIIDAGIRGELTEHNINDGNAENIYQEALSRKNELIKKRLIRRTKAEPITDDEKPFVIPDSWRWVRFADLVSLTNGIASRGTQGGKLHPVLRLADLRSDGVDTSNMRMLSLSDKEYETHIVSKNDLLFVRVNGSRTKVGNAYLFLDEDEVSYCDHLFCGHRFTSLINPEYIALVCNSGMAKRQIDPYIKTTAGQNTISQGNMGKMLIPLPPEAEQRRIVNRINELLKALPE